MRAIFIILILAVVALIAAVQTGLIDVSQTRGARAPTVSADQNGITATGGQTPAFDVETGSVAVGSRNATVAVPTVRIEPGSRSVNLPVIEVRRPGASGQPAAAAPAAPTTNATN